MIEFKNYRSILCLNGTLPPPAFFKQSTLPVIAADGAANTLIEMNITPEIIIGDLDSVNLDLCKEIPTLCLPDQNSCDFEKALHYLENKQLLPAIITGVHGGYLDHICNNINLFIGTNNILYAPPIVGFTLQNGQKELSFPVHTKISLLGIPNAIISSDGLQWELDHYSLSFPGKTSCFNRTIKPKINLNVHNGNVLVLIYC